MRRTVTINVLIIIVMLIVIVIIVEKKMAATESLRACQTLVNSPLLLNSRLTTLSRAFPKIRLGLEGIVRDQSFEFAIDA